MQLSNNVLGEIVLFYIPDAATYAYPLSHGQSLLPYADFTIFNETYDTDNHNTCGTCNGCGGFITTEYQGDYPQGGLVDFFEACSDCIGMELCPDCMQPLALSFDLSALGERQQIKHDTQLYAWYEYTFSYEDALSAMPFEGFTCSCCGWQYDPDRHYEQEDDYYADGDYPALDASDYEHLGYGF